MSKRNKDINPKIFIIHPGVQHAYQLANGIALSGKIRKIYLYTNFILPQNHILSKFKLFSKRVKNVCPSVRIYNLIFPELIQLSLGWIYRKLNIVNNNSYYICGLIFNFLLLPIVYFNRERLTLVLFDTSGWPLSFFAKKWNVRVVMDFPSISHEKAIQLGVDESKLGIRIKEKERQYIDYALFCSEFAEKTYHLRTSSQKNYVLPVGAETFIIADHNESSPKQYLKIAFIANMEHRKGLDILLSAFSIITQDKRLLLFGKISKNWVMKYCYENRIETNNIYFFGSMPQLEMRRKLLEERIDLHILPSRFDSFGMVVPETMTLGIPNILSPYVGAGELLEKGVDGFKMESLTVESLLQEIQKYLSLNYEEKIALKNRVIAKAEKMSWKSYYAKVNSAFSEILQDLH